MRFSAVYDPLRGGAGMGDDVLRRFADVVNAVLIEDLAVYIVRSTFEFEPL